MSARRCFPPRSPARSAPIIGSPCRSGLEGETDTQTVARLSGLAAERLLPEAYRLTHAGVAASRRASRRRDASMSERLAPPIARRSSSRRPAGDDAADGRRCRRSIFSRAGGFPSFSARAPRSGRSITACYRWRRCGVARFRFSASSSSARRMRIRSEYIVENVRRARSRPSALRLTAHGREFGRDFRGAFSPGRFRRGVVAMTPARGG